MSEINNTPSNTTLNAVITEALEQQKKRADLLELALTEAEGKAKELEEALACSKNREEFLGSHVTKWASEWQRAKTIIEAMWEDKTDDDLEEMEERLAELFEIEFTEEVEVTLTITYSGRVTIKKGADLGDLCLEDEPAWDVNLELDGDTIGNLTLDGTDYDY
jgi:chromosome segregation ATPase